MIKKVVVSFLTIITITLVGVFGNIELVKASEFYVIYNGVKAQMYWQDYTLASVLYSSTYCPNDTSLKDGEVLGYCLDGCISPGGVMMLLDFGYYTEYISVFKSMGYIPASYQLPEKFYTMKRIAPFFPEGVYTASLLQTECPEMSALALNEYNRYLTKAYIPYNFTYVPKYIRDAK